MAKSPSGRTISNPVHNKGTNSAGASAIFSFADALDARRYELALLSYIQGQQENDPHISGRTVITRQMTIDEKTCTLQFGQHKFGGKVYMAAGSVTTVTFVYDALVRHYNAVQLLNQASLREHKRVNDDQRHLHIIVHHDTNMLTWHEPPIKD